MSRWRVLNIGRTEISLHPALLLYGLYALLTGHGRFMTLSTGSILLHEAAHALVSAMFGQPPLSVELTPLGAVMHLDDESRLPPLKRALMLLAGPLMTLLLCWLSVTMTKGGMLDAATGRLLFMSNLSIMLLNLLPVLPLDGGRLLSMLLSLFAPQRIVNRIMQCIGTLFGLSLIALNIWCAWRLGGWNLSLAFAGCCMIYSAAIAITTRAMVELRQFVDRKIRLERNGHIPVACIATLHTQTMRQIVRNLPPRRMAYYIVFEAGSMRTLGTLTEGEVISNYLSHPETTCAQAISTAESN